MFLKGVLNRHSGTRTDVDREFVIMFTLVDENQSWYLDDNIRQFCTDPSSVDKSDAVFQRSNKMHGECGPWYITGFLHDEYFREARHMETLDLILQDVWVWMTVIWYKTQHTSNGNSQRKKGKAIYTSYIEEDGEEVEGNTTCIVYLGHIHSASFSKDLHHISAPASYLHFQTYLFLTYQVQLMLLMAWPPTGPWATYQ